MSSSANPLRGPLFMIIATAAYATNDTLMKIAADALPPFQVLTMRGIAALAWGLPLTLALGYGGRLPLMFAPAVLARNAAETAAVLCYIVALAKMPIADVIALMQVAPLIVLIGASLFLREPISRFSMAMIAAGFAGALMVAQPDGAISVYALLALANAVFGAVRDLVGRRIGAQVPGMIVALSAVIVVLAGATVAHLLSETWTPPGSRQILLLAGSGFFLIFGHLFLFLSYRVGHTATVAPFFYCFALWGVISGIFVFDEIPNAVAIAGILLIAVSGVLIVVMRGRRRVSVPAT
ncbi:MAG: DMT family transporter [Rhizobiales bacterium]|nr:DMT family transporter [Hyphomicrobiales bacterium]